MRIKSQSAKDGQDFSRVNNDPPIKPDDSELSNLRTNSLRP